MRIHPALSIAIGVAVLVAGLIVHNAVLEITGGFVTVLSIGRTLTLTRGRRDAGRRS